MSPVVTRKRVSRLPDDGSTTRAYDGPYLPSRIARPTGGPSLSTGGTGDVLTGIVGSLLARGLPSVEAATAGAFVHGAAGDLAGFELGDGATAMDVLRLVPEAVRRVTT